MKTAQCHDRAGDEKKGSEKRNSLGGERAQNAKKTKTKSREK